jgi:hypothetical protein
MRKKNINMMWRDNELENLRECQDLLRLNGEAETIRYLVSRGMEAMSGPLQTRRLFKKMEGMYSPTEMLPLFEKMGVKLE